MPAFEEKYMDVLQNIEMAIVSVYRERHDLADYDVDKVLNLVWTEYRNEGVGRKTPTPILNANAQLVYDRLKAACDWRLGRTELILEGESVEIHPAPISVDEMMDCLKRIRKSVAMWTKEGGRQGYFYFIDNNIGF